MNAVKNEEASQVSRLEEEIKALKQKLLAQQGALSLPSPSSSAAASMGGDGGHAAGVAGDGRGRGVAGGGSGEDGSGGDRCAWVSNCVARGGRGWEMARRRGSGDDGGGGARHRKPFTIRKQICHH